MSSQTKTCKFCNSEFKKNVNVSLRAWESVAYCSRSCAKKGKPSFMKGKKRWYKSPGDFKKGMTPWNKGKKWEEKEGEGNHMWKGESATMTAQHNWIVRRMGKPKLCQMCGTTEDRMYHWANISHEYKREISDYVRLCVPCHKAYDLGRIDKETLQVNCLSGPTHSAPRSRAKSGDKLWNKQKRLR